MRRNCQVCGAPDEGDVACRFCRTRSRSMGMPVTDMPLVIEVEGDVSAVKVLALKAVWASGGMCVPVKPYYSLMNAGVLVMPAVKAPRGGIKFRHGRS